MVVGIHRELQYDVVLRAQQNQDFS